MESHEFKRAQKGTNPVVPDLFFFDLVSGDFESGV